MSLQNVLPFLGVLAIACGGGEAPAPPPPAAAAPAAAAAKGSAVVAGKIAFEGEVPAAETVKLSADPKCQEMHGSAGLERQALKVKDGALADVFIYVKGLKGSYPAPSEAVLLDQKGCSYHPHVIAVQAGQPIKIRNSDDTLHNIHPRPQVNEEFNIGQPRQGMETTRSFDKPENMIPVGCDVHPWMRSYISVVGHPFFAVSGEDGSYKIEGLPAGDYEVEALHETLPAQTGKISVKDGESATLDLTFKS